MICEQVMRFIVEVILLYVNFCFETHCAVTLLSCLPHLKKSRIQQKYLVRIGPTQTGKKWKIAKSNKCRGNSFLARAFFFA